MSTAAIAAHLRREQLLAATNAELLQRFVASREEAAFAQIVSRHGPMVLRVCRQLAPADADDALQAVFLTLARRAHAIRKPAALASWLFGVAQRIAKRAARRQRRRTTYHPVTAIQDPMEAASARELMQLLDVELAKLPESTRLPLLLVYWQGRSYADAAREVGISAAALHGRLERGRKRLAQRLTARGFGPSDAPILLLVPLVNPILGSSAASAAVTIITPQAIVPAGVAALAASNWAATIAALALFTIAVTGVGVASALSVNSEIESPVASANRAQPPANEAAAPLPQLAKSKVDDAIDRGVAYLRTMEAGRGHWELGLLATDKPGGATALATLALLYADVPRNDPVVQRGLAYLRNNTYKHVYVVALQTMALAEARDSQDKLLIQKNVDWLWKARGEVNRQLTGWTYSDDGGISDNSNSQFAVLGLRAGRRAGANVDTNVWEAIAAYYRANQTKNAGLDTGGWSYHSGRNAPGANTMTMTLAGLCGLLTAGHESHTGRQVLQPDGIAKSCGKNADADAIRDALHWLEQPGQKGPRLNFEVMYPHYAAYGIGRAGQLSGRRILGGKDWFREGCDVLLPQQVADGSWTSSKVPPAIFTPIINTSLSLMFLSKSRTPVLLTKWAHGRDHGWNNKQHDAVHLVEFASRELFQGRGLAWQVVDARQLQLKNEAELRREVDQLLTSPMVYLNGHEAPTMTPVQKQLLKVYIERGGFVLAEACCGRDEFAGGFRRLMTELFPDSKLQPLPKDLDIWKRWRDVPPAFVPLEGIDLGGRTAVMFSPRPLAGYWEENDLTTERGRLAFHLAGNIIAYGTSRRMPPPRQ